MCKDKKKKKPKIVGIKQLFLSKANCGQCRLVFDPLCGTSQPDLTMCQPPPPCTPPWESTPRWGITEISGIISQVHLTRLNLAQTTLKKKRQQNFISLSVSEGDVSNHFPPLSVDHVREPLLKWNTSNTWLDFLWPDRLVLHVRQT